MALVYHLQSSPGCKCCACVRASTFAKIGLVFLPFRKVRLTANTTDEIDEDPTGTKAFWDRGLLNGAPQKVRSIFLSKMFIFLFLCLFQSIISSVLTLWILTSSQLMPLLGSKWPFLAILVPISSQSSRKVLSSMDSVRFFLFEDVF